MKIKNHFSVSTEDTRREDMMEAIYAARRGEMEVAEAWLDK